MELALQRTELYRALTLTSFSVCNYGTGTNKGILVETTKEQEIHFVSTDNIRMSIYKVVTALVEKDGRFIINPSELKTLLTEIKPRKKEENYLVCIKTDETSVVFNLPDNTIKLNLIPGDYPSWRQFIPSMEPSSDNVGDNYSINITYLADLSKALGKLSLPKSQSLFACKIQALDEKGPRYIKTSIANYLHIIMPMRG